MNTSDDTPEQDLRNPANAVLDINGLAALLGISAQSIPAQRSRTPHKLPPPFLTRPLRWRREAVVQWMQKQEQMEVARATEQLRTGDRSARRRGTARVIRVCGKKGTLWGHQMGTIRRRRNERKLLAERDFQSRRATCLKPLGQPENRMVDFRPRTQHPTTSGGRCDG